MFFKKKKIEPNIDSVIGYAKPIHWCEHTGMTARTFYTRKKQGKIIEAYFPVYKGETMTGWRKIYIERGQNEIL